MDTLNISFLCSPSKCRKNGYAPIEASITIGKKREYFQTGKTCKPEEFRALIESKKPNDVKLFCDAIRLKINQWQTQLFLEGKSVTAAKLKALLQGKQEHHETLKDCVNSYMNNKVKSTSAYSKYKNTFTRFLEFAGEDTPIENVTTQQIIDYKLKYEAKFAQGTLRNEMKKVKSLFLWAFNSGIISKTPFANVTFTFKDPEKPYLTQEEIAKIREAKLDERLDRVRIFFLFLCYSGLEYADMVHLEKDDVKRNAQGQLYIKKQRVKTKETYLSILFEDAAELWELFDGEIPMVSCQKANKYLKEVAEKAGIEKHITLLTGRHSYAVYLLSTLLIPIDIVQRMLGHTTNRQSLHYAKMLDSAVFQAATGKYTRKAPTTSRQDIEDMDFFTKELGI